MGIFGSSRPDRPVIADPVTGQVYLERQPGESAESFEARMAESARRREQPGVAADPEPRVSPGARPVLTRPIPTRERRPAREERPRRRGHGMGVLGFLVVVVAAIGVLWMVLAAREGSFAAGGAVVDHKLAEVTSPARVAANRAVDRTGQAVKTAGQGERIQKQAK